MPGSNTKFTAAVEAYLTDLRLIRASGGGTDELSYYPALTNLLNAVGGDPAAQGVLRQSIGPAGRRPP